MTNGSHQRQVETFQAYTEAGYGSIDLAGLAAFTIKRLQDIHIPVTFENLVVALFRLFPAKFSLAGFDQYPDAARAGRTLLQLGPKYRNWARGSVQKGFVLTAAGLAKATSVGTLLVSEKPKSDARTSRRPSTPRTMDLNREVTSVETSSLFSKWNNGSLSSGEPRELFDLLGAFAYTPPRALRDRLQSLENIAMVLGRQDVTKFLGEVSHLFAEHLRG